jgi:hypothetical protein
MKQMAINKNSWHYKVAAKFGGLNTYYHDDFCSYMRRVLLGCLALFGITLGCVIVAYLVSSGLFFIYLRLTSNHWPLAGWYAIGCMFDVCILFTCTIMGIIVGIAVLVEKRKERKQEERQKQREADYAYYDEHGSFPVREPQTHFIREAYAAFKEKTCYRINIE